MPVPIRGIAGFTTGVPEMTPRARPLGSIGNSDCRLPVRPSSKSDLVSTGSLAALFGDCVGTAISAGALGGCFFSLERDASPAPDFSFAKGALREGGGTGPTGVDCSVSGSEFAGAASSAGSCFSDREATWPGVVNRFLCGSSFSSR